MEAELISFIGTVGFPIVAFLLMFFKMDKTINANTEAILSLKEEIKKNKK